MPPPPKRRRAERLDLRLEPCVPDRLWCVATDGDGAPNASEIIVAALSAAQLAGLDGVAHDALWTGTVAAGAGCCLVPRAALVGQGLTHVVAWPVGSPTAWTAAVDGYCAFRSRPPWVVIPEDAEPMAALLRAAHSGPELFCAASHYVQGLDPGTDAAADLQQIVGGLCVPRVSAVVWIVDRLFDADTRLRLVRHLAAPLGARRDGASPLAAVPLTRSGLTRCELTVEVRRDPATGRPPPADLDLVERQLANLMWRKLCEPLWDDDAPPAPPGPLETARVEAEFRGEPAHGPAATDEVLHALADHLMATAPVRAALLCDAVRTPSSAVQDALASVGYLAARFFLLDQPCAALAAVPVGVWAAALGQPYPAADGDGAEAYLAARRRDGRVGHRLALRALRVGVRWAFGPTGKWLPHVVRADELRGALLGAAGGALTVAMVRAWVTNARAPQARALFRALGWVLERHEGEDALRRLVGLWTGLEEGRLPRGGLLALEPRGSVGVGPQLVAHQCAHQLDLPPAWVEADPAETGPLLEVVLYHAPAGFGFA